MYLYIIYIYIYILYYLLYLFIYIYILWVIFTSGLRKWTRLPKPTNPWSVWAHFGWFWWAILGLHSRRVKLLCRLCWAMQGPKGTFKSPRIQALLGWRPTWEPSWAYMCHLEAMVGRCWIMSRLCWAIWGYVGILLGHFKTILGLCWAIWRLWGWNLHPNGSRVPLRLNLGSVSGLGWAIWRLCWAFVGSF